jgi:two-component system, response regulator
MKAKKLILLVEDDPDDEELARLSLAKYRPAPEVVVARDGVEALDYIFGKGEYAERGPAKLPALILLDLKLPRMSGLDVLRQLREKPDSQLVPVVMLSSSGEPSDIKSSYELGANSYVRKPIDFSDYTEAMRDLGDYWLRINEPVPSNGA